MIRNLPMCLVSKTSSTQVKMDAVRFHQHWCTYIEIMYDIIKAFF